MKNVWAFCWGCLIGVLGGLIGLGGAKFRLPVLISIFKYRILNAIVINLIVVVLLISLGTVLIGHDFIMQHQSVQTPILFKIVLGFMAGMGIGVFSSMLGVAGGELIIPTIILLFSVDIKLASSLSLAISIPIIIMGLVKYKNQQLLNQIRPQFTFISFLSLGSIVGALIGSRLLSYVPWSVLHLFLGLILLFSAVKLLRRKEQ